MDVTGKKSRVSLLVLTWLLTPVIVAAAVAIPAVLTHAPQQLQAGVATAVAQPSYN